VNIATEETKKENEKNSSVMIVDDEDLVLQSLTSFLSLETDYELLTFQSPKEALKELNRRSVDIVISDFLMPEMNGLSFLHEVKKLHPDAPRILLTGYADKENAINAINQVGLYQYIEKPWDNQNIKMVIRNGLRNKNLNELLREKLQELDRVLLHREELAQRNNVLSKELSLARRLQDSMLPTTPLLKGDISIFARYKPALEIGGDFFDVIDLNKNRIAILIADVTGHGIQSALSTMLLKFAFSSFADKDVQSVDIIRGMNKVLHKILPIDIFVAALVVTMDTKKCTGSIVNGGIPHPLIIRNGGVDQIPANGLILGVADDDLYESGEEFQIDLHKEENLILYTDGLSEIEVEDGKLFEDGGLVRTISENLSLSLDELLDRLLAESDKFEKTNQYKDDLTILGIKRHLK
jgi:serine phosphatase RsbU (regulator of sigma subunit)